MGNVISKPFVERDGKLILQCHSRGEKRFSPFFCSVEAFTVSRSIENHYQCSKVFSNQPPVTDWKQAKELQVRGVTQIGWQIGNLYFDQKPNNTDFSHAPDDWGIQWYVALWIKYLKLNPDLVEVARKFDDFEDPFKGRFPFCQADVIRQAVRGGIDSLKPMCVELLKEIIERGKNHV